GSNRRRIQYSPLQRKQNASSGSRRPSVDPSRSAYRAPSALSAEHAQQRVVTDLHQSEPHRHAEHEGEGKVRHTVELEEQCRENPEQRERPQDETDNGLQDREEHEHRQPEHVPKKPERALEKSPAVEIGYGHTGRRSLATLARSRRASR